MSIFHSILDHFNIFVFSHIHRPMPSFAHAFYFWFSLIFLIGRTLTVCMYAAHVYEQSKLPIHVLRAVPNDSWCLDVQRFSEEVVNHTAALSGMRFFYLTRGLVLSVSVARVWKIRKIVVKFYLGSFMISGGRNDCDIRAGIDSIQSGRRTGTRNVLKLQRRGMECRCTDEYKERGSGVSKSI